MPELSTTDANPILTGLLTELAQVFTERDDFRDEVERLQEQYAEAREDQAALRSKLDRQEAAFGQQFLNPSALAPKRGSDRANRHKLTPAQVGGIRSMVRNGSQRAYVARVYGVHPTTVSRIANGTYHREGTE